MLSLIVSPAFSFLIFNANVEYLMEQFENDETENVSIYATSIVWLIWVLHIMIHRENNFNEMIFKVLYALSVIMQLSLFASLALIGINGDSFVKSYKLTGLPSSLSTTLLYLFLFTISAPFICAILLDRKYCLHREGGFRLLVRTVIPFYLSFYLMIPWFSSYSFARCWDLSWGNRPADEEKGHAGEHGGGKAQIVRNNEELKGLTREENKKEEVQAKFKNISWIIVLLLVGINIGVYSAPYAYVALFMASMLLASSIFMGVSAITLTIDLIFDILEGMCFGLCTAFTKMCEKCCPCCVTREYRPSR